MESEMDEFRLQYEWIMKFGRRKMAESMEE